MFTFTLSPGKGATGSTRGADTATANELASMSPEAMRKLLMQQQSALASLQSKIDKMSIQEKAGVPDLTLTAIKEVLDKPKMASWMRRCGAAVQDYVGAVERPLARPTG